MNFDSVSDKIKRFRRLFSCFFKKFEIFTPKIAFFYGISQLFRNM